MLEFRLLTLAATTSAATILGSAMQPPPLARLKKPRQLHRVGLIRSQLDRINAGRAKQPRQVGLGPSLALSESGALAGVTGIDFDHLPRLGVAQDQPPERRQFLFKPVRDLDGDHV